MTADIPVSKSKFKVRVSNRESITSLKSAERLVKRGQARWEDEAHTRLHIIEDDEKPLPVVRVPQEPAGPRWPAWYDVNYPDRSEWQKCWRTTEAAALPSWGERWNK